MRRSTSRARATQAGSRSSPTSTPSGAPRLLGLGLALEETCCYLAVGGTLPAAIVELLADPRIGKLVHDAKTARRALRRAGADLQGIEMDTMIASYLANASRRQHLLEDLATERLHLEIPALPVPDRKHKDMLPTLDERLARAGTSAVATLRLAALFRDDLDRLGLAKLFREIELPLVDVLVHMEEAGIKVDTQYLATLAVEFTGEVARIEREAYAAVGHEFGINSPKQLQELLFTELKLPRGRRTGTGFSTDAAVLEELRGAHPVVDKILEYREVEKLRSTYAEGLGPLIDRDGRIHTTFNQTVASTGRLSSQSPNLQNIPIRTPLGRRIRRAFVAARPEQTLLAADYSQIELARARARVAGSGAPRRVPLRRRRPHPHGRRGLRRGRERGHPRAAQRREDAQLRDRVRDERLRARLADGDAARGGRAVHRRVLQAVRPRPPLRHGDEVVRARAGLRRDAPGRRRYIPDMASSNGAVRNAAERMAINMPIQGTAADIMKIAMVKVHERLRGAAWARAVLQVHDELVFEVDRSRVDELADLVRDEMGNAYPLDVPLVVDIRTGDNWDEMTPLPAPAHARSI